MRCADGRRWVGRRKGAKLQGPAAGICRPVARHQAPAPALFEPQVFVRKANAALAAYARSRDAKQLEASLLNAQGLRRDDGGVAMSPLAQQACGSAARLCACSTAAVQRCLPWVSKPKPRRLLGLAPQACSFTVCHRPPLAHPAARSSATRHPCRWRRRAGDPCARWAQGCAQQPRQPGSREC